MNKIEVYNLIKNKKELNLTYKDISLRTGYHIKSLIRIGNNIDYYINKLKDNDSVTFVLKLINTKDKTYKEIYYEYLDASFSNKLSFAGLYKLLKRYNIETCYKNKEKTIKVKKIMIKKNCSNFEYRKILQDNKFQYKSRLYKIINETNLNPGKKIRINKLDLSNVVVDGKIYITKYLKSMPSLKGVAYFRYK